VAPACNDVELVVAASDYTSSLVCGAPGCVAENGKTTGADLGGDPMLVATNGRDFYLARDKDLLFEIDARCGMPLSRPRLSVHDLAPKDPTTGVVHLANPHDAAAAPDGTVVVALYNTGQLAFAKNGKLDSLDISSFDPDGNPQAEAVRIVEIGGAAKAFVALERLDNATLRPTALPSQMLRIDVATRTVEATIDLAGKNPFNPMSELAGAFYLAEPGDFDAADDDLAGIERFDSATSTTQILVHEHDLGGSVAEVAVTDGCGAAIVAGPLSNVNPTSLATFDPTTGHVIALAVLGPTAGYDLEGLAWRGRTLYVGDRRPAGGGYAVHLLEDRGGCNLADTGRTIELPQRPVALRPAT
jgi:hypothetical protein